MRLLDHARARKADQRAGFGDIQVAQHRVARGDAARGGIGQNRNERHARFVKPRQRRRNFRKLHQADGALPSSARRRSRTRSTAAASAPRERSTARATFSPTTAPIDPPIKPKLHRAADHRTPAEPGLGGDNRIVHPELLLRLAEPRGVRLGVVEMQADRSTRDRRSCSVHGSSSSSSSSRRRAQRRKC